MLLDHITLGQIYDQQYGRMNVNLFSLQMLEEYF